MVFPLNPIKPNGWWSLSLLNGYFIGGIPNIFRQTQLDRLTSVVPIKRWSRYGRGVKLEDYTAEGQPCSGITGLGAGQKPCARRAQVSGKHLGMGQN